MEFHKILAQIEASEQQWLNWTLFIGFRYEAMEVSINTSESLFPMNVSGKFFFFTKNIDA